MTELSLFAAFCFFLQVPQYHGFVQQHVSEVLGVPIFSNNPSSLVLMDGEFEPAKSNEKYAEIVQEDQDISDQAEKPVIQTPKAQNATSTDQPMPNANKILQAQQHLLSQDQKQVRTIQDPLESTVKSADQSMPKVGTGRLGGSGSTFDEFYWRDNKRQCRQDETSQLQTQQRTQGQQALSSEHEQVINTASSIEAVPHKSQHVPLRNDTCWAANPQVVCNFQPGFDLFVEINNVCELKEYAHRQRILFNQLDTEHSYSQFRIQEAEENITKLTVKLAKYRAMEIEARSNLETAKNATEAAEESMKNAMKYSFPDEIQQEMQKNAESMRFRQADAQIIHGKILTKVLSTTQEIQHLENRLQGLLRDYERLSLQHEKNKLIWEEAEENATNAEVQLRYSMEEDFLAQADARVQDYHEIIAEEITEDLSIVIDPCSFSTSSLGNSIFIGNNNQANPIKDELNFIDVDAMPPSKTEAKMNTDVKVVTETNANAILITNTEKDAEGCQCEDFTKTDAEAIFSTWLEARKEADAIKEEAKKDPNAPLSTKLETKKEADAIKEEAKKDPNAPLPTKPEANTDANAKVITETDAILIPDTEKDDEMDADVKVVTETNANAISIANTEKDAEMDANVEVVPETDPNAPLPTKPEAKTDANAKVVTETDAISIPDTEKDVEMNADVKVATEELNEVADGLTIYLPANTCSQNHFLGEHVSSVVAISTALITDSARPSKDKK